MVKCNYALSEIVKVPIHDSAKVSYKLNHRETFISYQFFIGPMIIF